MKQPKSWCQSRKLLVYNSSLSAFITGENRLCEMDNMVGSARVFGTTIAKLSRFSHKTISSMLLNSHLFALSS